MNNVGHTGPANLLVLRLTNVHIQADERTICRYFNGYRIVDQIRTMNPKTRTLSAVYVMLGSVEDRNRALKNLNFGILLGRQVHIMPAHAGNYRINATHNGFVHDEWNKPVVAKPTPPTPNVLSNSEFPVLGNITPAPSPPRSVKPQYSAALSPPKDKNAGQANNITSPQNTGAKGTDAMKTGNIKAIFNTPEKSPEKSGSSPGIELYPTPCQDPPVVEQPAQPTLPFPYGQCDWYNNMPSALQYYYLTYSLPPPYPVLLNPTVDAAPVPAVPQEDFSRPALPHTPPREDLSKAPLGHISQPNVRTTQDPGQPYTDTAPRKHVMPIVPLGGQWNISGNDDAAANVVSENDWYNFLSGPRGEKQDCLDISGLVSWRDFLERERGGGGVGGGVRDEW